MQGANLNVQIVADSSKFRVDLALSQAALRATNKEIKSLSDAAQKMGGAGQSAIAAPLQAATGRAEGLERQIKSLNKSINGTTRAVGDFHAAAHPHKFYLVENSLQSLNGAFMAIGHNIAGAKAAMAGFAIGIAFTAILEQLKAAHDELEKIQKLSLEIGRKPLATQASTELARQAGLTEEEAAKFLQARSDAITKVMTATGPQTTFSGVRQMRGQGPAEAGEEAQVAAGKMQSLQAFTERTVQTFRGGVPVIKDYSDALKEIGLNADAFRRLKPDEKDRALDQALISYARNAEKAGISIEELNTVSKQLVGLPMATALKAANAELDGMNAKTKELETSQRGATEKRLRQLEEQRKAEANLEIQQKEARAAAAITAHDSELAAKEAAAAGLKAAADYAKQLRELPALTDAISRANFADQIQGDLANLPNFFQGITTTIGKVFGAMFDAIGKGFISSAQAAEKSGAAMSFSFKGVELQARATAEAVAGVGAAASATARLGTGGGGAGSGFGVGVFRGPGTGPTGGHGPGSFATQSITPGLSDYQAPPHQVVYPSTQSTYGSERVTDAAEASRDAAIASQNAAEASRLAVQGWVDPRLSSNYASGGYVRGAGSGTSDSIMARLSNGEFVMRAAAVKHWGPRFLSSLNGFAGGGMVMPSRGVPSFASGGMVHAGGHGGAVVNLNFPGGSFSLYGDNETVGALTREARRAGMLQGGRPAGVLQ